MAMPTPDEFDAKHGPFPTGDGLEGAFDPRQESQWRLMWQRFRQNRLSVAGLIIAGLLYVTMVFFTGFIAPYYHDHKFDDYVFSPPTKLRFVDDDGNFHWRPFIYGRKTDLDFFTLTWVFTEDPTSVHPIYFFVRGDSYRLLGLIPTDIHLFGTLSGEPVFLLGTDRLGRDLLSRIIYGGQISLTVGLVGVVLTIFLGTVLGTVSGYYGGSVDNRFRGWARCSSSFRTSRFGLHWPPQCPRIGLRSPCFSGSASSFLYATGQGLPANSGARYSLCANRISSSPPRASARPTPTSSFAT